MINRARVRPLNEARPGQGPRVYWMSRDQRVRDNWALLYAQ
jgi:deoxyribodipyrimidine photo-lyase